MTSEDWIDRVIERHTAAMTRPEFLKAVRALSARYVERRADLVNRSALDSAGKRAAFGAFYAPLHFLVTREIVRGLGAAATPRKALLDLGCGTGVASAAWALEFPSTPRISGVDLNSWALEEARWNWRAMGLDGRPRRSDLVDALPHETGPDTGIVVAWSLNELAAASRGRAEKKILALARGGTPIIVIEPIATRSVPWWPDWITQAEAAGGRAREWKFSAELPRALHELDRAAGFRRDSLGARSVSFNLGD